METVFGIYDPNMKPTRVVDVVMGDNMRFSPDLIKVKKERSLSSGMLIMEA